MAKRKANFKGKVLHDAKKRDRDSSPGYLTLPDDFEYFVPEPGGRTRLDFLPYIVTDDRHPDKDEDTGTALKDDYWYKRPFKIHREIGPESVTIICPTSVGRKCPICQYRAELLKERKDYKDPDIKALAPKDRILYIVVPVGMKKYSDKAYLWDFSYHNFHKLLGKELQEDESNENFPHPEEGQTVHIRFDEESFEGQAFAKASRIDFKPRDYTYEYDMLDELPSLDELIHSHVLGYKELNELFLQMEDADVDDKDFDDTPEEEKPAKTSTIRKAKKLSTKKPAEEEPEDDTPAPGRKKKTLSRTTKKEPEPEGEQECPSGFTFGSDIDKHEECNNCTVWNECNDASKNGE